MNTKDQLNVESIVNKGLFELIKKQTEEHDQEQEWEARRVDEALERLQAFREKLPEELRPYAQNYNEGKSCKLSIPGCEDIYLDHKSWYVVKLTATSFNDGYADHQSEYFYDNLWACVGRAFELHEINEKERATQEEINSRPPKSPHLTHYQAVDKWVRSLKEDDYTETSMLIRSILSIADVIENNHPF